MGFFAKVKQSFKEKQAERAELKKAYKEEYAKEKAIQESGRRLTAREEARERARAKARLPPISERLAVGAGRLASGAAKGVGNIIKESAKSSAKGGRGVDFLGVGGAGTDFFGMPTRTKKKKRKSKTRSQPTIRQFDWF